MDSPETQVIFIFILLLIIFNALFILMEVAITETHKNQIEKIYDDDSVEGQQLLQIIDEPRDYLTAVEIGSVGCNILIGICSTILLSPYFINLFTDIITQHHWNDFASYIHPLSLIVTALIIIILSFLFSTILPRRLATHSPVLTLAKTLKLLRAWKSCSLPFIKVFRYFANTILMLFGVTPKMDALVTEDEVKDLIERATEEGTFEKVEQDIVDRIFHMSDQTAYSLMTPRTQMLWLDIEDKLEHNLHLIKCTDNTVFVVGKDNLDEIVGIIYTKDILNALLDKQPVDLEALVRKPMFVPRSMESFRLLEKFRHSTSNEAIVLDEYGGVVGFITVFDLINEVLGDVASNPFQEVPQMIQHGENTWYVDGLYDIDDFKEKFSIEKLPHEEHGHFKTMGGFLTSYFGYIPKVKEVRIWDKFRFEVINMDKARIAKIAVTVLK